MIRSIFALLVGAVLFTGCASFNSGSKRPAYLQELQKQQVDSATYAKIYHGRVLQFPDILELVQRDVPDAQILAYLKSTQAAYRLTNKQLTALTNAGAGAGLVNYLGKSTGYFEATSPTQTGGSRSEWSKHPYFWNPYYYGAAPFDYAFPPEWYDMGFFYPLY